MRFFTIAAILLAVTSPVRATEKSDSEDLVTGPFVDVIPGTRTESFGVVYSPPAGGRVALTDGTGRIRVIDVVTGQVYWESKVGYRPSRLFLAPQGCFLLASLVSVHGTDVIIFDTERDHSIGDWGFGIPEVHFSDDGQRILIGRDRRIRVYDLTTYEVASLDLHGNTRIAVSPDARRVLLVDDVATELWEPETRRVTRWANRFPYHPIDLTWHPRGWIAVSGSISGCIELRDPATGSVVQTLYTPAEGAFPGLGFYIAFGAHGERLITIDQGSAASTHLWAVSLQGELTHIRELPTIAAEFDSFGNILGTQDNGTLLAFGREGELLAQWHTDDHSTSIALSPLQWSRRWGLGGISNPVGAVFVPRASGERYLVARVSGHRESFHVRLLNPAYHRAMAAYHAAAGEHLPNVLANLTAQYAADAAEIDHGLIEALQVQNALDEERPLITPCLDDSESVDRDSAGDGDRRVIPWQPTGDRRRESKGS